MTMKQKPAPTLQELLHFVSDKLGVPVSVATLQKDIYAMRYDESLGFHAPIEYDPVKKGYVYTDPDYSIHQIPVSEEDLQGLEIAVGILNQFKDIPAIRLFEDALQRLAVSVKQSRDKVSKGSVLLLDRPARYQGIEFMPDLVEAIRSRQVIRLHYLPFTKTETQKHTVHPYFIKEYNGRMYLIGQDIHPAKAPKSLTFAFDRIKDVVLMNRSFQETELDIENYFRATIGISMTGSAPQKLVLQFDPAQSNYIKTRPLHPSQQIIKDTRRQFVVSLELVLNYELKSLLLGFGDQVQVLKPQALRQDIQETIRRMRLLYDH